MMQAKDGQVWTTYYVRLIGYVFLILTVLDLAETFYPPSIKEPTWLLPVMGLLVERAFAPLIGVVLIFWGAAEFRGPWERQIVRIISWLTLLISLLYLLLIPLGISSGIRIDKKNNEQVMAQYRQGTAQINQVRNQVNLATDKDMKDLLETLKKQGQFQINSVDELRTKLPEQLDKSLEVLANQALNQKKQQRNKLIKNITKWGIGALVIAMAFLLSWRATKWAR